MPHLWALEGTGPRPPRSPGSSPPPCWPSDCLLPARLSPRKGRIHALTSSRRAGLYARRLRRLPRAAVHAVPHVQGARLRRAVPRAACAQPAGLRRQQARRRRHIGGSRARRAVRDRGDDHGPRRRADDRAARAALGGERAGRRRHLRALRGSLWTRPGPSTTSATTACRSNSRRSSSPARDSAEILGSTAIGRCSTSSSARPPAWSCVQCPRNEWSRSPDRLQLALSLLGLSGGDL